jgi:hypothetical protein
MRIFVGVLAALILTFAVLVGRTSLREYQQSQNMVATEGVIATARLEESSMANDPQTTSRSYHPVLEYSYEVAGVQLQGDRYRISHPAYSYDTASKILQIYPVGSRVTVWYDPDSPAIAVLDRQVSKFRLGVAFAALTFSVGLFLLTIKFRKVFPR